MVVLVIFLIGCFGSADNALDVFKVAAWVGILTSLLTFYFASALYLNEMTGRTLLKVI